MIYNQLLQPMYMRLRFFSDTDSAITVLVCPATDSGTLTRLTKP